MVVHTSPAVSLSSPGCIARPVASLERRHALDTECRLECRVCAAQGRARAAREHRAARYSVRRRPGDLRLGLASPLSLLSEPVPFEPHRTRACCKSSPELGSALTGRSSGQPSSRLRLLTAAAHLYVRQHVEAQPNASVDWDSVHRSNYESAAFNVSGWLSKAQSLYVSAKALEPQVSRLWESYRARHRGEPGPLLPDHYLGTYFMLMAFAVENLLKAGAVAQRGMEYKATFRESLAFPRELRSHNLVKLASTVGLRLREGEEDLLRRLARSAVWCGRYPAPMEYSAMSGTERHSDGSEYSVSWFGGNDVARLQEFILSLPSRVGLEFFAFADVA